jgi:hypothetical protein
VGIHGALCADASFEHGQRHSPNARWLARHRPRRRTTPEEQPGGSLTKLAGYRGTSCNVDVRDYVVRRINCETIPQVERGIVALREMTEATLAMIRLLDPKDFEILVDLVFSTSGWRRQGLIGKTQKTLDLDLVLPSTGERAFVQVKSRTTPAELADYISRLEAADDYARMFMSITPAMSRPMIRAWY